MVRSHTGDSSKASSKGTATFGGDKKTITTHSIMQDGASALSSYEL